MKFVLFSLLFFCFAMSSDQQIFTDLSHVSVMVATPISRGSGTIIKVSKKGSFILTCAHVIQDQNEVLIAYDDEGKPAEAYPVIVVKIDKKLDLALLFTPKELNRPAAKIAIRFPENYETLYTVGCPHAIQRQAFIERISAKDITIHGEHLWIVDGTVISGMSGGGIFNANEELECVIRAVELNKDKTPDPNVGLCIPLDTLQKFLPTTF